MSIRPIGIHTHTSKNPAPCRWTCRVFCFLGLHRWCLVCMQCECCGRIDKFLAKQEGNPR